MNNKIKPIIKIAKCILIILLISGCQEGTVKDEQGSSSYSFYVGTYTDKNSKGIYKYSLHKDGSLKKGGLAAKTANPAYLAFSMQKKYLLAGNEIDKDGSGTVESYLITDDSLLLICWQSSGGAHPCFITLDQHGFVLVANWTGGNVGLLSHVGHEPTRGSWPRNICLSPDEDYLLVANRHGNNIVSFQRDEWTGIFQYVTHIEAPSPACIVL